MPNSSCNLYIVHGETLSGNSTLPGDYTPHGGISLSATGHYEDGSGDLPVSYSIAWGDGTNSTGTCQPYGHGEDIAEHLYPAPGTYNVTITYSSTDGVNCQGQTTKSGTITILPSITRYFCQNSQCVGRPRVQGSTEGFATCEEARCDDPCNFNMGVGLDEGLGALIAQISAPRNFLFKALAAKVENGITTFLSKTVRLAINWGDGNTTQTSIPTGVPQAIAHHYTTRGTYTISWVGTVDGCPQSASGSRDVTAVNTRYFCQNGQCNGFDTADNSGYSTSAECERACGNTNPVDPVDPVDPVEPPSGPYICLPDAYGTSRCSSIIPADYIGPRYPTLEECRTACGTPPLLPLITRYMCIENGQCAAIFTTDPTEGFDSCQAAGCSAPTEPQYIRYVCSDGNCVKIITPDRSLGYATQRLCLLACANNTNCHYIQKSLVVRHLLGTLTLSLQPQGFSNSGGTLDTSNGWTLVLHHTVNNQARPDLPLSLVSGRLLTANTPDEPGQHHFEVAYTKPGCPPHIAEANITIEGTDDGGDDGEDGGGDDGDTGGDDCPPCPPPPDAFVCSPSVAFVKPEANAALRNFVRVRVTVADPNEETDPCHHNYNRPCNHVQDAPATPNNGSEAIIGGPALQLFLGDYKLPVTWKHVGGTPLNGIWEAFLDTRDYSNGAHDLRVTARGVGCCRCAPVTRNITLTNTLQGNIFYRDTRREVRPEFVIPDALIGIETRALEENTARRYWMQTAVRSGTTLDAKSDAPYKHDDWPKHQPVFLTAGESWESSGGRFERHNYSAHVTFRLPLSNAVRVRRKWTPQFYLSAFDLNAERVAKIRELQQGRHYVFTNNPARVWIYENDSVTVYGDFSTAPTPDPAQLGAGETEDDFDYLDRAGNNVYAPDATDCAILGTNGASDKVYVVVPPSNGLPRGEVFAFDHDSGQLALDYGVRRENRTPRFIEAVGPRVICLYTHDESVEIPTNTKRTRAYDLTFSTPRLLWQLAEPATLTAVDGDTLFIACGTKLYSTNGTDTPTLLHEFPVPISAISPTFVGLQNGHLWQKTSAGWILTLTRTGPIGGVTSWTAGTAIPTSPGAGEPQTAQTRGLCAGEGIWLSGQRQNGSWYHERDLRVPLDLAPKSVQHVTALDHYSVQVEAPETKDSTDVTTPPQRDERLLIGTAANGLLFVYQRSNLSEADGALPVSHDTIPRIFPFPRQKPTT